MFILLDACVLAEFKMFIIPSDMNPPTLASENTYQFVKLLKTVTYGYCKQMQLTYLWEIGLLTNKVCNSFASN